MTVVFRCMAAGLLLSGANLNAQGIDPTRPPAELASSEVAVETGAPALQSVILREGARPAAMIGGKVVELGGKLGESRLIKVGEDYVVLRSPAGDETLRLMPAAEKKIARTKADKGAGRTSKEGSQKKRGVEP